MDAAVEEILKELRMGLDHVISKKEESWEGNRIDVYRVETTGPKIGGMDAIANVECLSYGCFWDECGILDKEGNVEYHRTWTLAIDSKTIDWEGVRIWLQRREDGSSYTHDASFTPSETLVEEVMTS